MWFCWRKCAGWLLINSGFGNFSLSWANSPNEADSSAVCHLIFDSESLWVSWVYNWIIKLWYSFNIEYQTIYLIRNLNSTSFENDYHLYLNEPEHTQNCTRIWNNFIEGRFSVCPNVFLTSFNSFYTKKGKQNWGKGIMNTPLRNTSSNYFYFGEYAG